MSADMSDSASLMFAKSVNPSIMIPQIEQEWSLPESLIYYIAKNPSSGKLYDKLLHSCKYFFHKNPILVVNHLKYGTDDNKEDEDNSDNNGMDVDGSDNDDFDEDMNESDSNDDVVEDILSNSEDDNNEMDADGSGISDDEDFDEDMNESDNDDDVVEDILDTVPVQEKKWKVCLDYYCESDDCCKEIDLKKLSSKLWVCGELCIDGFDNLHSEFIPKLAGCEASSLVFSNMQIMFNDFVSFGNLASDVVLSKVNITHDDGKVIPMEEVLRNFPNLRLLIYRFTDDALSHSPNTAKSLLSFPDLTFAHIYSIPETFDIEGFCESIDKDRKIKFELLFAGEISEAFKSRLDTFVDTVIKEYPKFGLFIYYPGLNHEKHWILRNRFYTFN